MADGGRRDDLILGSRRSVEDADEPAIAHHGDAVGQRHHLLEVGGHEQDAEPLAASRRMVRNTSALAPTSMPRLGSSISSTFGPVISALPMTTFCWLPPLTARRPRCAGSATLIAKSPTALRTAPVSALAVDVKAAQELVKARQRQIAGDRQDRHETFALPVLRNQRKCRAGCGWSHRVRFELGRRR